MSRGGLELWAEVLDPWLEAGRARRLLLTLDRDASNSVGALGATEQLEIADSLGGILFNSEVQRFVPSTVDWARRVLASGGASRQVCGSELPEKPSLRNCPTDICARLRERVVATDERQETVVFVWLEWLLRQVEMRGGDAGVERTSGARCFSIGEAMTVVAAGWLRLGDLRFLNCLLRGGDLLLRRGPLSRRRDDAAEKARIVAVCGLREAAMDSLESEGAR